MGVLPSICDALKKYGPFCYFDQWFIDSSFPTYFSWKSIVYRKIREFEANAWDTFITDHPDLYIAHDCLVNTPPRKFCSISEQFPDLVCCLHTQVRLMGSLGLNGGIPWLRNTEGTLCFIYKQENETLSHFLFVCTSFRRHLDSLWANLVSKINNSNPRDGAPMSHFIMNLNQHHKTLLLLGCLPLPFDISTMGPLRCKRDRLSCMFKRTQSTVMNICTKSSVQSPCRKQEEQSQLFPQLLY